MSSRSIGTLTTFINADAAQFMKEWDKVDRRIARASKSFTEPGAKLALGFLGVENALKAVTNEMRFVIGNIESIPGVPAETTASIITMRDNLAAAKNWIDQMTAGVIAFGVQFAQAVGAGAASLMGYEDTSGLAQQETPDQIARAKDAGFDAKIDAARKKLAESSKAAALATQNEAQQIVSLRTEAARYETFAKSNSIDTVQRLEAQTAAQDKLKDANAKMTAMNKQLADSEKEVAKSMTGAYTATLSRKDAIAGLEERSQRIFNDLAKTSIDKNDPEGVQRRIELNKELAGTQKMLGELYKENAKLGLEVGSTIASGFEEAVFAGKGLSETLRGLADDILRLLFRQMITAPIAKGIGGMFTSMFGGFFADGGRPPMGKVSVVGENGPELFVPDTAGRIIPNKSLNPSGGRSVASSAAGGSGSIVVNQSYNIGAGVTASQLMPILAMQKRDLLATIVDAKRRRGSLGGALA